MFENLKGVFDLNNKKVNIPVLGVDFEPDGYALTLFGIKFFRKKDKPKEGEAHEKGVQHKDS